MKVPLTVFLLLGGLPPWTPLIAQVSASANYSITTATVDGGGEPASSTVYAMDGSIGAISGASSVASPAETAHSGYVGQLYNVTALQITAPPGPLNVDQTFQLGATGLLDDGTVLVPGPAMVAWSVQSGPIVNISSAGLATTGLVYQDTAAEVSGSFAGFTASLGLTVANVGFDAWQAQYFGMGNPLAAPGVDADGTGQTNLFKYIAGLNPIDPTSFFTVKVGPVADQSGEVAITFSPTATGRTYVVQFCTDLSTADWQTLAGSSQSTVGNSIIVVDPDTSDVKKFYRVQISDQ